MKKTIIAVAVAAAFTQGCVPFAVWFTQHQIEVAGIAAIGGAVYAVEQAGIGAIDLKDRVTKEKP